jgi:flavodoxin I
MHILVAYYSETGNTRMVAEAIFAGIRHTKKNLLPIEQAEELGNYDLIFCGFPVQHHSIPTKMTHFLQSIPQGKKLALFATHGSLRGGEKAISAFYAAFSLTGGRTILGTFGCLGPGSPKRQRPPRRRRPGGRKIFCRFDAAFGRTYPWLRQKTVKQ